MMFKSKWLRFFLCALFILLPATTRAQVVITFYSHELGASFPHAFITLKGTSEADGAPIDANYGFTAKSISPAILLGSVVGVVEAAKPAYIKNSDRKFSIVMNDIQYRAVVAVIARWKAIPGKSYNLNKRNCVHFVGEVAQAVGIKVVFDQKLMKKPRSFLDNIIRLNPNLR